jgi:DNA-binding MarR family transcriptional regulator
MTNNSNDITMLKNIDRIIHEPARLIILAQLYVVESVDYIFLLHRTGLTQGNLSAHLNKLETAEYIEITKEFVGKRPHTLLKITELGRNNFRKYISQMKDIFDGLVDY